MSTHQSSDFNQMAGHSVRKVTGGRRALDRSADRPDLGGDGRRASFRPDDRGDGRRASFRPDERRDGPRSSFRPDERRDGRRSSFQSDDRRDGRRDSFRSDDRRDGRRASFRSDDRRDGRRSSFRSDEHRDGRRSSFRSDDRRDGRRSSFRSDERRDGRRSSFRSDERRDGRRSSFRPDEHRDGRRSSFQSDRGGDCRRSFRPDRGRRRPAAMDAAAETPENLAAEQAAEPVLREDRIEGRNPVREALKAGRSIEKAWILKSQSGSYDHVLYELIQDIKAQGGVIIELDRLQMDQISETYNHQGIIVQAAMHEYVTVGDILARAAERGEAPLIFILDKIQDAYNLGSILRIADGCGAHGVIIPQRRAVGLNALVAKASAGAIEHVPCCRVNNLTQTVLELKARGIWIAGTDSSGRDIYAASDLTGALAIVIGSEGDGVSPTLAKHCDFLLSIPMLGQVNSLNAAVACGITAFEVLRQRRLMPASAPDAAAQASDAGQASAPDAAAIADLPDAAPRGEKVDAHV